MTSADLQRHSQQLDVVADAVEDDLHSAIGRPSTADIDRWWAANESRLVGIVRAGAGLTAQLGAEYLQLAAAGVGLGLEPVLAVVDLAQLANSLRIVGPVAFKKAVSRGVGDTEAARIMTGRLVAAGARHTLNGSRATIVETADRARPGGIEIGWIRIAQAGACDFCEMLAGRGAVYRSAASAGTVVGQRGKLRGTREMGASFHDNCRCVIAPVFRTAAGETVYGPATSPATTARPAAPAAATGPVRPAPDPSPAPAPVPDPVRPVPDPSPAPAPVPDPVRPTPTSPVRDPLEAAGDGIIESMPVHQYKPFNLDVWRMERDSLARANPTAAASLVVHDTTEGTLGRWVAGLTGPEQDAVTLYTTAAYLPMNKALTDAAGSLDRADILAAVRRDDSLMSRFPGNAEQLADAVELLRSALLKHPVRADPIRVYRGVHPDTRRGYNPRSFYEGLGAGDEFVVDAFSSTSLQEAVSEGFTGRARLSNNGNSVMMEIDTRVGANVINLAELGEIEAEVVLPPGTRFRVVEPFDPTTQKIRLEVIGVE